MVKTALISRGVFVGATLLSTTACPRDVGPLADRQVRHDQLEMRMMEPGPQPAVVHEPSGPVAASPTAHEGTVAPYIPEPAPVLPSRAMLEPELKDPFGAPPPVASPAPRASAQGELKDPFGPPFAPTADVAPPPRPQYGSRPDLQDPFGARPHPSVNAPRRPDPSLKDPFAGSVP